MTEHDDTRPLTAAAARVAIARRLALRVHPGDPEAQQRLVVSLSGEPPMELRELAASWLGHLAVERWSAGTRALAFAAAVLRGTHDPDSFVG